MAAVALSAVSVASPAQSTKVVMLGTGTPIPDPDRGGPGVAIVIDSAAYLFDAGAGIMRRAAAAGLKGVAPFGARTAGGQPSPRFERVFLTHLHSDHTLGLPDLYLSPTRSFLTTRHATVTTNAA